MLIFSETKNKKTGTWSSVMYHDTTLTTEETLSVSEVECPICCTTL